MKRSGYCRLRLLLHLFKIAEPISSNFQQKSFAPSKSKRLFTVVRGLHPHNACDVSFLLVFLCGFGLAFPALEVRSEGLVGFR